MPITGGAVVRSDVRLIAFRAACVERVDHERDLARELAGRAGDGSAQVHTVVVAAPGRRAGLNGHKNPVHAFVRSQLPTLVSSLR